MYLVGFDVDFFNIDIFYGVCDEGIVILEIYWWLEKVVVD